MSPSPPTVVWVVEVSPRPDDYYDHNVTEVAGIFATLEAAQEHHPSPAWTHHEASPTGAEECWVSDDMTIEITAMPVQGPPRLARRARPDPRRLQAGPAPVVLAHVRPNPRRTRCGDPMTADPKLALQARIHRCRALAWSICGDLACLAALMAYSNERSATGDAVIVGSRGDGAPLPPPTLEDLLGDG